MRQEKCSGQNFATLDKKQSRPEHRITHCSGSSLSYLVDQLVPQRSFSETLDWWFVAQLQTGSPHSCSIVVQSSPGPAPVHTAPLRPTI